jgi:predicted GNAT family acetyltransferase
MYTTRIFQEADRAQLNAFLLRHADSSMILLGNLHDAGVEDRGQPYQGPYAGAFDDADALRAVAAQYRNGNVFAASDEDTALDAALRALVTASGKPVKGIIGLRALVQRARRVLELESAPAQIEAAYRALGFERIGDWRLLLLR